MSDAVKQAVEAMKAAYDEAREIEWFGEDEVWPYVLAAIPTHVLALLAIEEGGLERCGKTLVEATAEGSTVVPVYRLVDVAGAGGGLNVPSNSTDSPTPTPTSKRCAAGHVCCEVRPHRHPLAPEDCPSCGYPGPSEATAEAAGPSPAGTPDDTGEVPIVECERPAHADGHHGPECHDLTAEDAWYEEARPRVKARLAQADTPHAFAPTEGLVVCSVCFRHEDDVRHQRAEGTADSTQEPT